MKREGLKIVNAAKVRKKIPSLLIEGASCDKLEWAIFMRTRYRVKRFKKKHPEQMDSLVNELVAVLEKIDEKINKI